MSNTRVYFFRKMRVVDLDWVRTNSTLKKLLWLRRNLLNSWKSERRRVKPRRLKMCFSRLRGLCKNKLRYMSKTAFLEFWRSNNYHNLALFSILWPFYDFRALKYINSKIFSVLNCNLSCLENLSDCAILSWTVIIIVIYHLRSSCDLWTFSEEFYCV